MLHWSVEDLDLIPRLLEIVENFPAGLFSIKKEAYTKILSCVGNCVGEFVIKTPWNYILEKYPWVTDKGLDPYPWIFGIISERVFWKTNPESSLVTSQLDIRKCKLYVQIQYQVGLLMMLIRNGICLYVRKYAVLNKKYMPFFWIVTERDFREKNPKNRNIQMTKRRSVMVPRICFFFRITDKC